MRRPRNRAERRAVERAAKRMVRVAGKIGVKTRFVVKDADGRDVTAQRTVPRDT